MYPVLHVPSHIPSQHGLEITALVIGHWCVLPKREAAESKEGSGSGLYSNPATGSALYLLLYTGNTSLPVLVYKPEITSRVSVKKAGERSLKKSSLQPLWPRRKAEVLALPALPGRVPSL
jgi:hypothetical protein